MIQEIGTNGTGATVTPGTVLEIGGMIGRDNALQEGPVRFCRCRPIIQHEAGAPGAHGHCGLSCQSIS
eukprot:1819200-Pyramimonas_sp.AAC.1